MIRFYNNFRSNSYANRGMSLEDDINQTNEYYRLHSVTLVYKKPTPIRVVNVEYPKNKIREAYFNEPSTLDYNGVYQGRYLEFDAKETQSKTSFPLSNIHKHQLEHIENVIKHQGIAFLIVRFTLLNEAYVLMGEDLIDFIRNNERKSIPLDYFKNRGYFIEIKYTPRLDYIKVIDKIIQVKGSEIENEKEK